MRRTLFGMVLYSAFYTARGPYRKKLDRLRDSAYPIKFEHLGFRPAQMFEKCQNYEKVFRSKTKYIIVYKVYNRPILVSRQPNN